MHEIIFRAHINNEINCLKVIISKQQLKKLKHKSMKLTKKDIFKL